MGHDDLVIIGRVTGALVIGALIGFERTFHGRPAGFRTHSLVCIASAILMIVTVYQNQWMTFVEHDAIRTDPSHDARYHDRHRISWSRRDLQRRPDGARPDDSRVYLGYGSDRHFGGYRVLVCCHRRGCGRTDRAGAVSVY